MVGPDEADPASSDASRAVVVMLEPVMAIHTIEGSGLMDVKPLLQLMDICTCASAEKHTGVNCVTASMGDVVFEHFPRCGEMLELRARPVFVGRTSLDVALTVVAEGTGGVRRTVCDATFTYVTTKGPGGEKRFCPPLDGGSAGESAGEDNGVDEKENWDRKMAQHRRGLMKVEAKGSTFVEGGASSGTGRGSGFDIEMSEVVLPAHQNHMGDTFGGVVMSWMAKAALAAAARESRRSTGSLLVRSVLRVNFSEGSGVSDHLIFRPRVNAFFDQGQSAEVEVRVSKKCIATGTETGMNVGYFYVSGSSVGNKNDRPFARPADSRSSISSENRHKAQADAEWRRRLLVARGQLLAGLGEPVEWHPALHESAPRLTIMSVLRLVHHNDPAVKWNDLFDPEHKSGIVNTPLTFSEKKPESRSIEWTSGEGWGRSNTFVLRAKGLLSQGSSITSVLYTLRSKRPQWDKHCVDITTLEDQKGSLIQTAKNKGDTQESNTLPELQWDVVQHLARAPDLAVATRCLCSPRTRSIPATIVPLCLLRAWRVDSGDTAVLASRSVKHTSAAKESSASVHPSGWFLRDMKCGGVELIYIAEHDLTVLRKAMTGVSDGGKRVMSDIAIISKMGSIINTWFDRLASFEHTEDPDRDYKC